MNEIPTPKRTHLIQSAGYWFEGSRKAAREGKSAEAVFHMENAYNHVENALYAARKELTTVRAALEATEKERDEFQSRLTSEWAIAIERDTALAELAKVKTERDGLDEDVSAQRSDITERDAKIRSISAELSRLRAENAAKDAALRKLDAIYRGEQDEPGIRPQWLQDALAAPFLAKGESKV